MGRKHTQKKKTHTLARHLSIYIHYTNLCHWYSGILEFARYYVVEHNMLMMIQAGLSQGNSRVSIKDVLAVNADERGLAIARRTLSSLTAVLPETRRTERTGSVPSCQIPKKGVILLLGSITLIPPTVLMKPSSYLRVTVKISIIITLAHPENRRGSSYY